MRKENQEFEPSRNSLPVIFNSDFGQNLLYLQAMSLGYQKNLCILAFDQRASLSREVFDVGSEGVTEEIADQMERIKMGVYEGFRLALQKGVKAEDAAILVDEQFGHAVLSDAAYHGLTVALTTEKSGLDDYDFEYGEDFASHLLKYRPAFAKALVRRNPEMIPDGHLSVREHARLLELKNFCERENMKMILELLVPPTEEDLKKANGSKAEFDLSVRPELEKELLAFMQKEGIEADVWKVEGFPKPEPYKALAKQARAEGRKEVGLVILGRNASLGEVESWLTAGATVPGVIGFAVGRTIFLDPVKKYHRDEISWEEMVETIANRYLHLYQTFQNAKSSA